MFTKIANIILGLGVAAGLIGSIPWGVSIGKGTNGFIGFLFVLIGWIVTFVIFTFFGMIVEMANNISKSREYLEMLCGKDSGTPLSPPSPSSYDLLTWICPRCKTKNSNNFKYCTKCRAQKPGSEEYWYCSKCGEKNENVRQFCVICAAPRIAVKQTPVVPKSFWKCPQCGEMNDEFSYTCKKCGKSKH